MVANHNFADVGDGDARYTAVGEGVGWQEAQDAAERMRKEGKPFTSYARIAALIGCEKSTLHKAIKDDGTVELQEWASKQRAASRLNVAPELAAVILDSTPQGREPNPADILEDSDVDVMLARLLDQAGPDERARINAMSPAERRQLAKAAYHDPDLEEQALRRRKAKRTRRD